MNENTTRGLLAAGLSANVLLLALALLDYSIWDSDYMWPIFVAWAFVIILIVILAFVSAGVRVTVERPVERVHFEAVAAKPTPAAPPFKSPAALGPFQYNGYTLYSRQMTLKGDSKPRTIHFFAKKNPKSGHPVPKPFGYHVGVNEKTGLPFLKKGAGKDGEDLTPEQEQHYRPQCSALTEDGKQCRNSAREGSKYCSSHFGYQPPSIAKAEAGRADSLPRVRNAKDTKPSVRKKAAA